MKLATLDILNWNTSLGGEHYTGTIHYDHNGETIYHELEYELSTSQAKYLNKKDGCSMYKQGSLSNRFFKQHHLYKIATEFCKSKNINLLLKHGTKIQPGVVIYCSDEELKKKLVHISALTEWMYSKTYDPWATFGEEADRLWDEWESLLKDFK